MTALLLTGFEVFLEKFPILPFSSFVGIPVLEAHLVMQGFRELRFQTGSLFNYTHLGLQMSQTPEWFA